VRRFEPDLGPGPVSGRTLRTSARLRASNGWCAVAGRILARLAELGESAVVAEPLQAALVELVGEVARRAGHGTFGILSLDVIDAVAELVARVLLDLPLAPHDGGESEDRDEGGDEPKRVHVHVHGRWSPACLIAGGGMEVSGLMMRGNRRRSNSTPIAHHQNVQAPSILISKMS